MSLSVCCVRRYRRLHRGMASEGVTVLQIVESSDGIGAAKAAIAQHEHDDPPWMGRRSSQPHDCSVCRQPRHDGQQCVQNCSYRRIYSALIASSLVLISGLSCNTTFNKELWTSSFPLYSMKPNLRNLFMKKLTRDRVVPIISASVS
jgi:hypothetical protein